MAVEAQKVTWNSTRCYFNDLFVCGRIWYSTQGCACQCHCCRFWYCPYFCHLVFQDNYLSADSFFFLRVDYLCSPVFYFFFFRLRLSCHRYLETKRRMSKGCLFKIRLLSPVEGCFPNHEIHTFYLPFCHFVISFHPFMLENVLSCFMGVSHSASELTGIRLLVVYIAYNSIGHVIWFDCSDMIFLVEFPYG